ncbi:hypothetical protein HK102_003864 [Quaeritorhiza haematococci]|nr:hypothetical protein HK102_003864 [Quaeritorhiza haematococci]
MALGVFGMKALGYDDFDILGQADFLLVPLSSFETPEGRREYKFVEGYLLIDNPDKLIDAPDWLVRVLTRGSNEYRHVREVYLKQVLSAEKADRVKAVAKGLDTNTPVARSASVSSASIVEEGLTAEEEALITLDLQDRVKEVAKHVKKLSADRAIDCQSWIEVGMAIHHATHGQGMELWDKFSRRAGPYDRAVLETQWDSFKNGSGITIGSLIHWAKEDTKAAREERKTAKEKEERMKNDDNVRREAVKFGVDHTGRKGVLHNWDAEKSVAVIRNTMHHPDHRVECVFNSDGGFQWCLECDWRNPFAGELVVSQSKYPVLHQQFFNVTINNTVHIYQGDLKPEGKSWVGPKAKVVLEYAQQNGFLRESGYIYKPIHKWAIQRFERKGKPCDYKGFVNMVFEGDAMKVWEQPGVVSTLASIMEDSDADAHFPLVTRDHRFAAFKNGVWDLQTLNFYDLSTDGPGDIIAGHYFDFVFPSEEDLASLETPEFDNLVGFQIADPEVYYWFLVLIGRLQYTVKNHDSWQIMPFLQGAGGTGKSTVLSVIQAMFPPDQLGNVGSRHEAKFGLQGLSNKRVVIAPDIPSNIGDLLKDGDFKIPWR